MANNVLKCASCHKTIKVQSDALHALRETWHKKCFKCSICSLRLAQEFFSRKKDGIIPRHNKELYCKQHYLEKFKYACYKCHKKITGLIQVAADVSFHPECFRCIKCRAFIGHGDDYVFEERSRLLCRTCHQNDVSSYKRFKGFRLFQHSDIHHVQIAPSQLKNKLFSLIVKDSGVPKRHPKTVVSRDIQQPTSVVSIVNEKEDSNLFLKTGDTILEINGEPVTSRNVDQFSALLKNTRDGERRLSFLIQRNPDEKCSPQMRPRTPRTPCTADPEKYRRNVSFFNFSVDRPITPPQTPPTRRHAFRTQATKGEFDFLPVQDQNKILRISSQPQGVETNPAGLTRSKSLNDILSMTDGEENRLYARKDLLKSVSPLQRAQTLKPELHPSTNQVFRPIDLVCGEVIGKGAFGDVFKITDNNTGKVLVMKKLREIDAEAEEQFLKEVQLLKSLQHPNVLRFVGVMYKDRTLHIITEYVAGGTLRGLLKNNFIEISWKQRIEVARDISAGMSYLHSQHVIHRDLKSKNVLIQSTQGRRTAIVADFGLASVMKENVNKEEEDSEKSLGESKKNLAVRPNFRKRYTVVGTCYWMAPEILNHKAYNETVDIFSFGIVICEIISRVKADPDELPRSDDFGLDVDNFTLKFGHSSPEHFLLLAVACCDMKPSKRPPFECCEKWLQRMLAYLEFDIPLPNKNDVDFCEAPEQPRLSITE